jgi:hypothetical protein
LIAPKLDRRDGVWLALDVDVKRIAIGVCALLVAMIASNARAQDVNKFALGMDFTIRASDRASSSDYAHVQVGPGLLWRFGEGKPGWGFHWGLNWYSVDLDRPIGGNTTELGELHVRPIMAGYGYTYVLHHITISADALGGYAFDSMSVAPTALEAYRNSLGAQWATADASNAFVFKPEIGMWHNVNRKIGLNANFGYMFARPSVTITTAAGSETRTARADQIIIKVGIVYSIF